MSKKSIPQRPESTTTQESARRRLLKGGMAAAPVLMTLVSGPILGQTVPVASANCSLAASCGPVASSSGLSPSEWAANVDSWPDYYHVAAQEGSNGYTTAVFLSDITGLNGSMFGQSTMLDVLNLGDDGGVRSLARYVAAALLNARAGYTDTVLAESAVRRMWNDVAAQGHYEATAGIHWGPKQIVNHIKSTIA